MMKSSTLAITVLGLAAASQAFDEYLPLAPKTLEVDGMFTYSAIDGWDDDGDSFMEGSPASMTPSLQIKYGIIPGLDVELGLSYLIANEDWGDVSGIDRPNLAVKYAHPELGVGGFLAVDLPFGSEDIVGTDAATTFKLGALYGKTFGQVMFNGLLSYKTTLEVNDAKPADELEVFLKPQYNLNEKLGVYLGVDWLMSVGDEKAYDEYYDEEIEDFVGGTIEADPKRSALSLRPGVNFILDKKLSFEVQVPVTVMAKNFVGTYWGVYAGVYYTIGL